MSGGPGEDDAGADGSAPSLVGPHDLAGDPTGSWLWTPHRMVYLLGEDKPSDSSAAPQCPFCRAPGRSDEEGLMVARGELAFVVLNLYPTTPGT